MQEARKEGDASELRVRPQVAMTRLRSRTQPHSGLPTRFDPLQLRVLRGRIDDGPTMAATIASADHITPQSTSQSMASQRSVAAVVGEPDAIGGRKNVISLTDTSRHLFSVAPTLRGEWLTLGAGDVMMPRHERHSVPHAIELLERLAAAHLAPSRNHQ
jgi:hypothetical protein